MNKIEAIQELSKLDRARIEKLKEADFWANEYRLAGSASKYVRASEKPTIARRYNKANADEQAIWAQMVDLMDSYGIGPKDLLELDQRQPSL
jgi:hypothetical protein